MPAVVEPPTLLQFVLLSMLLHVLVVVLFGNAPGIGARRGEGWWGPLDVTLRRLTQPAAPSGIGPFGERGAPAQRRSPTLTPEVPAPEKPEATPEAVEPERQILIQPSPIERIAPPAIERELMPLLSVPLRAESVPPAAPLEKIAPSGVAPAMAPPVELRPHERPIVPSAPIERLAPEQPEHRMQPPVSLPPRELPKVPSTPIERLAPQQPERPMAPPVLLPPRELPQAPSTPIERLAPQQPERPMAPPVSLAPRESPRAPSAPIERLAPQQPERPLAPPVSLPPRESPQLPSAPVERLAPLPSEHELSPPVALPPRETPQLPAAPMEQIAPRSLEQREIAPRRPEVAPEERLPNLWFAPRPDESMFKERRDVVIPSTEPGELPHIDREGARQRAREIASGEGSRRVINLALPVPPEKKSKEAQAIDKAGRPDCRTEYADLGLLAVPALLANAITDTGCKW
ncbi:MAG TPA: hypothetical protein VMQ50_11185 [Casimicrobiaceae bacterium]|nr:hypothetical protein [Casimicrobiaceae bacterium]